MSTDNSPDEENSQHPYETDESFHPLGAEWEDQMRENLEETDFDADLGMEMARDAQRLVAGEISEKQFYAEYHDAVDEEFEADERPVFDDVDLDGVDTDEFGAPEGGSMLSSLGDVDLEGDDATRREMMKKMGAGAAFLGYGAYASYDNGNGVPEDISGISPPDEDERENRWGMVIDLERCDSCLACVAGCVDENGTSTGANWMYVMTYEDEQSEQENRLVRPCQHCSNAPCAKVCPVRARHVRDKDGLVLTDYEICIGCRYCQVACPYGVNYFQWGEPDVPMDALQNIDKTPEEVRDITPVEERQRALSEANDHVYDNRGKWTDSRPPQGTMGKCTFCPSRQDEHTEQERGTVACMDACDEQGMSAIHFGDLDDPESRANRYLRRRAETEAEDDTYFDAELSYTANDAESIDVDGGFYPLFFLEQQEGRNDWRQLAQDSVVVVSGASIPESDDFGESTISDIGGVPADTADVLSTADETDVTFTVVFDDDEFDEATEREFDVSLALLGETRETLASESVTLTEGDDEVDGQLHREVTETIDGSSITADENEGYVLALLVTAETDEGTEERLATYRRVFLTADGQSADPVPDARYDDSQLEGELQEVPELLYTDETATIEGAIGYPTRPATHDTRIVLWDGTSEDTIGQQTYEFTQTMTSNTPWRKLSTFRLLEDLGTDPSITYLGPEPGPNAHQHEGPVTYEQANSYRDKWGEYMEIIDKRKEHLDYGAGARERTGTKWEES